MKKLKKVLVTLIAAMMMLSMNITAFANENVEIKEMEVTLDQLHDGITVVLTKGLDGNWQQSEYSGLISQEQNTNERAIKSLTFHLGLKDWKGSSSTGNLYYTVSANEPLLWVAWRRIYS